MLCLTTGPGFRLTSPASSKIKANLNVGLERGIGNNFEGFLSGHVFGRC